MPEAEILSILKSLKAREIKLRLRGLFFAHQTMDIRVFEQLVKMYAVKNEIRENVYQAMVRLNKRAFGKFSPELLVVIKKEVDRLKGESYLEAAKFISSFIGQIQDTPDSHLDSFVKWSLSNLNALCGASTTIKDDFEIRCDIYFALQGDPIFVDKLADYFNHPTTDKHDSQLIDIFISRKDPRLFKALIEEMASCNPSIRFVELLFQYAKAINTQIPEGVKVKMQKILDDFKKENADSFKDF